MEGGRTFVRLSYAYSYGVLAGMAMQTYLGIIGRDRCSSAHRQHAAARAIYAIDSESSSTVVEASGSATRAFVPANFGEHQ
jgi:hypothetical protein